VRADHFSPDVQELIEKLARHGVGFLLVGGEAVIYHGYPRLTGDVDLWYEQTADNATRLFAALREFWGGRVPGVETEKELSADRLIASTSSAPSMASRSRRRGRTEWKRPWIWSMGGGSRCR
jgi:hypothetical protein